MKNGSGNGAGGPMAGWCIVVTNGRTLIGRPSLTPSEYRPPFALLPVYELVVQTGQNPQGAPMIKYSAVPVLLMAGIKTVNVPVGALVIELGTLTPSEIKRLDFAVREGEELAGHLRAADSGIAVASEIPKGIRPPWAG